MPKNQVQRIVDGRRVAASGGGGATAGHTHDGRYYTEVEVLALLEAFALLAGRDGGQVLCGGTGAGENLLLRGTLDDVHGFVLLQLYGGNVGIGTANPVAKLEVEGDLAIYNRFYTTYYGNYVNFGYAPWFGYFGLNIYADESGNLKRSTEGYGGRGTGMIFGDNIEFIHTPAGATVDATVTPTIDMRIDYTTGHVGIGTGSSAAEDRLQVKGGNVLIDNGAWYKVKRLDGYPIELLGIDPANNVYVGAISDGGGKVVIREDGVDVITLHGGKVGMGTSDPTSKLQVVGLPVYANNAAAIAGGLTAGAFYRTGADPDPVCVVH